MQKNCFSDRLKTIDVFFFKKRRSVTLDSDLNFREGHFDWSAFHQFGFVVDGAPSCLFAGTGGRWWIRVLTGVLRAQDVHTRGGVVFLFPQRAARYWFNGPYVLGRLIFCCLYIGPSVGSFRLGVPLFRPFVSYCVGLWPLASVPLINLLVKNNIVDL